MRLHTRLTLLIVVLTVAIGGTLAVLVSDVMYNALKRELEKKGVVIAQTLVEHITHNVIDGDVVTTYEILREIAQRTEDVEFVYIVGFDNNVFAHSFEDGFPRALLPCEHELIRADTPQLVRYSTQKGKGLLIGYPLIEGMRAHLHIGLRETYLHRQVERTRNQIIGITLTVALLAALFGIALSRSIARPLEQLSESLRAFGKKRVEQELNYHGGGQEVANLIHAFNQMITERKQAEETLRKSENLLRTIADNYPNSYLSIIEKDLTIGFTAGREFAKQHLDPNSFVGLTLQEVFGDQTPIVKEYYLKTFHGEETSFELYINNQYQLYTTVPLYEKNGEIQKILAVVENITERKRAEEELSKYREHLEELVEERTAELSRLNMELARASRLKDEFLANMSHELRTPLNVILGMSEALQEQVYGELNDKVLNCLRRIEESGRHLLQLITDILDLSKISAGKLELTVAPVTVELVCQASLVFIKQPAQKKRIKVLSTYDHDVSTFHADELRIKQVLVNLLTNAVKFTSERGTIGLEVKGDVEKQVINFTVWDTGIGIARKDMKRLFQPFVQLDSSLSRQYEGTGLGLSLVYRLVELHGGSISVESRVGQGSRFTISLPWKETGEREMGSLEDEEKGNWGDKEMGRLGDKKNKDRTPHPPISPSPQSATILIAEDNETNIRTFSEYLSIKGYRVIIARTGKEAIERTKEEHPDIVLMDIQMPEIDGLEAIRCIRADDTIKAIPIIAVTALVMPGDRERCLDAGADAYLSKPVSLRGLRAMIEKLLSNTG